MPLNPRRSLLLGIAALLAAPRALLAQQGAKTYRIGVLASGSKPTATNLDASTTRFVERLRELGYVEGKNLIIEWRYADGESARLPRFAAELVASKVDVIVTQATPATFAAKQATTSIPIVFWGVTDPVGRGLVADIARPGGNLTGGSNFAGDAMIHKQFQLLHEINPKLTHLAFFAPPVALGVPGSSGELPRKMAGLGVKYTRVELSKPEELEPAFNKVSAAGAQAVILTPDALYSTHYRKVIDLANKHRLPIVCGSARLVENGALLAYGGFGTEMADVAATYVDKVLKGAKPADLPIIQASKMSLIVNVKAAKSLGLTIPQSMLLRADRVIE